MDSIRLKARAKINISLDVVGKREDGYHNLKMIMQTIDLYDKVSFSKIKSDQIRIKTNVPFLPTDEKNLVYKIIAFMKNEYGIKNGVSVDLFKVIPIAAGLAGGSADGAATIKGMDKLFNLKLSLDEMIGIGKKFGADIPYCLVGGTALAEGIGDELTYLKAFPNCYIVLVKPTFSMSTPAVYKGLKLDEVKERPNHDMLLKGIEEQDVDIIAKHLCNVLESVTIKIHPEIEEIKQTMVALGASGALMSGSGSSVYGIFKDEKQAEKATGVLKKLNCVKFAYKTTVFN